MRLKFFQVNRHFEMLRVALVTILARDTAILYWTYRAELTNYPSFRVNQK